MLKSIFRIILIQEDCDPSHGERHLFQVKEHTNHDHHHHQQGDSGSEQHNDHSDVEYIPVPIPIPVFKRIYHIHGPQHFDHTMAANPFSGYQHKPEYIMNEHSDALVGHYEHHDEWSQPFSHNHIGEHESPLPFK